MSGEDGLPEFGNSCLQPTRIADAANANVMNLVFIMF